MCPVMKHSLMSLLNKSNKMNTAQISGGTTNNQRFVYLWNIYFLHSDVVCATIFSRCRLIYRSNPHMVHDPHQKSEEQCSSTDCTNGNSPTIIRFEVEVDNAQPKHENIKQTKHEYLNESSNFIDKWTGNNSTDLEVINKKRHGRTYNGEGDNDDWHEHTHNWCI